MRINKSTANSTEHEKRQLHLNLFKRLIFKAIICCESVYYATHDGNIRVRGAKLEVIKNFKADIPELRLKTLIHEQIKKLDENYE